MKRWFRLVRSAASLRIARRGAHRVGSRLGRFTSDRSGATAIQAMAMMPLIIISTFGLFKAWEVVQVKESLHTATYEAVRYLSLYPTLEADEITWEDVARRIIENELKSNPWITRTDLFPTSLVIDVTFGPQEYECKMDFDMAVSFNYELPNVKPFPGVQFKLNEQRKGEILCK